MTVKARITRRNTLAIVDDVAQVRGHGNGAATTVAVTVTDYKGDLPLNPSPWCRLDVVEHWMGAQGRSFERGVSLMLNEENRRALIAYLQGDAR